MSSFTSSDSSDLTSESTSSAEDKGNMGSSDDIFETSSCPMDEDADENLHSTNTNSESNSIQLGNCNGNFYVPSDAEEKSAYNKCGGLEMICRNATGLLYIERYESFVIGKWPYDVKRGNLCHPKALAMAGLGFHSLDPSPTVQCQVCLVVLKDLQPNSNPWVLHSETNPMCYLVKLGQRQNADEYTLEQLLTMSYEKIFNAAKLKFQRRENMLRSQLEEFCQMEQARGKENQAATANDD